VFVLRGVVQIVTKRAAEAKEVLQNTSSAESDDANRRAEPSSLVIVTKRCNGNIDARQRHRTWLDQGLALW
jgi:hypothetical protein